MKKRFRILSELFLMSRLYLVCSLLAVCFIAGFFSDLIFLLAKIYLLFTILVVLFDFALLFLARKDQVFFTRETPEKFSNGDENPISIFIKNEYAIPIVAVVIDEIPMEFQLRNFQFKVKLAPSQEKIFEYKLKPTTRGEYFFGKTYVYASSPVGLLCRRFSSGEKQKMVPVYPSFLNIRKYAFLAISNRLTEAGIKRIRRIGQHSEFDQIKEYVKGDDSRTINWKATAKKGKLMINQYQDERSQQIYNIIDMGRVMEMPFNELSLLDYSINSSLVLANTALLKHDKAGLITFNTAIHTFIPAERKNKTMMSMMEALYNQQTLFAESNFELLYISLKRYIPHRSLLVLYTNFESLISLSRQLPFFQKIARSHLLLIVIFENTEITELSRKEAKTLEEIYIQTIAEKFSYDKRLIIKELNNHGILAILTHPYNLSVNLVNKYLELKDRNLI